jgi:metal-dependent hydrolase (beta-lactamase superfamily II)
MLEAHGVGTKRVDLGVMGHPFLDHQQGLEKLIRLLQLVMCMVMSIKQRERSNEQG